MVPASPLLNTNVAVGVPLEIATVVGVKVPVPALLVGVTVTVPVIVPFALTVKFCESTPTVPEFGPVSVVAVAAAELIVIESLVFVSPPSSVELMV
jgi:hypothetical protein